MYFISHDTKIMGFFVAFKQWQRWLATSGILLIVASGWYFGIYAILDHALENKAQQLQFLNKQCVAIEEDIKIKSSLQEACTAMNNQLKEHMQHQYDFCDTQFFVFNQINDAHLVLQSYNPDKAYPKEWYSKKRMTYTLQGRFPELINVLNCLRACKRLIACKEISIVRSEPELLHITCLLDFIQFNKEDNHDRA